MELRNVTEVYPDNGAVTYEVIVDGTVIGLVSRGKYLWGGDIVHWEGNTGHDVWSEFGYKTRRDAIEALLEAAQVHEHVPADFDEIAELLDHE